MAFSGPCAGSVSAQTLEVHGSIVSMSMVATNETVFIIRVYKISILVTIFRLHSKSTISARVSGSKFSRVRTVLPVVSDITVEVSSPGEDGLAPSTVSLLGVDQVLVSFADRWASCMREGLSDNAGLWSVDDHKTSYMSEDMTESGKAYSELELAPDSSGMILVSIS